MIEYFGIFFDDSIALSRSKNAFCYMERRCWAMALLLIAILLLASSGCSPTTRIAKTATEVSEVATSSKDRFAIIRSESESPSPDLVLIANEASQGVKEQQKIIDLTAGIHRTLPSVEDQVPEWVYTIQYVAIALIALVGAWVLWHTGLGTLVKRIIGFVPKAKNVR